MKKIIYAFVCCIFSTICFCQERINRENIHFLEESGIITTATGWKYNEVQGKWIDNKNCISDSWVDDINRFTSIQIKTFLYDEKKYYIFIKSTINKNEFYILKKEEYERLFTLTNQSRCIYGAFFVCDSSASEEEITYHITKEIYKILYRRIGDCFIDIYKATDGNIRFLFHQTWGARIYNAYFEITEDEWLKLKIKDKSYYEYHYNSYNNSYNNSSYKSGNTLTLEQAYTILGVKSTDDNATIKKAYYKLALANHPDKVEYLGGTERQKAEERFKRISEAYQMLKKSRNIK